MSKRHFCTSIYRSLLHTKETYWHSKETPAGLCCMSKSHFCTSIYRFLLYVHRSFLCVHLPGVSICLYGWSGCIDDANPNTLQHAVMYCNMLQHAATHTTQHAATRCNTYYWWCKYQDTATRCNILQHAVIYCNMLQHAATHCNMLQRAATCNMLRYTATHCNTLATHCNTLQHVALQTAHIARGASHRAIGMAARRRSTTQNTRRADHTGPHQHPA